MEILITSIIAIIVVALLLFIIKKTAKVVTYIAAILLIIILIGLLTNLNFKNFVKEKTAKVVGMAIGKVEDKAVDYAKENINISKIKDNPILEVEDQ